MRLDTLPSMKEAAALDVDGIDRSPIVDVNAANSIDNEHRRRHAVQRVTLANLALLIEQHGKGHVELVRELPRVRRPFLIRQVDRQYLQVLILVSVVRGDDVGHLPAAWFAPGGPEIENHGTTRVIG